MLRNVFNQSLNRKRNFEKISSGSWFSVHVLSVMCVTLKIQTFLHDKEEFGYYHMCLLQCLFCVPIAYWAHICSIESSRGWCAISSCGQLTKDGPPLWMLACNGEDIGGYATLSRSSEVLCWVLITTEMAVRGKQTWGNLDRFKLC